MATQATDRLEQFNEHKKLVVIINVLMYLDTFTNFTELVIYSDWKFSQQMESVFSYCFMLERPLVATLRLHLMFFSGDTLVNETTRETDLV